MTDARNPLLIGQLGGLTEDERAQLAADLRRTQDEGLRKQIEEWIENHGAVVVVRGEEVAVVYVDELHAELGRIFGDRPKEAPTLELTPELLDLMEDLKAGLSAAERRERTSARNERPDGHVEGVDR